LQHSCKSHLVENVLVKKEGIYIKASNWLWHGHMQTNQINKQLFLMYGHLHQELSKISILWCACLSKWKIFTWNLKKKKKKLSKKRLTMLSLIVGFLETKIILNSISFAPMVWKLKITNVQYFLCQRYFSEIKIGVIGPLCGKVRINLKVNYWFFFIIAR
jgi:hypothetical protein